MIEISTLLTIQDVIPFSLTIEEKYIWGLLCQEISMVSPDLCPQISDLPFSLTIEEKYIWGLLCQEISMVSPDFQILSPDLWCPQIYIVGALSLIFF